MNSVNGIGSSAAVVATQPVRVASVSTPEVQATNAAGAADSAKLSPLSLLVQNSAAEDVRSEKVAAIKESIQAGTYNVPASAVADKLVQSMLA